MVHIPTSSTIYIDAAGREETRTIMRAELVAIYTALTTFEDHPWIGIFTDSKAALQAIRHHHAHPGIRSAGNYHHHNTLLEGIVNLLEERIRSGKSTTLHKIRAHTHVRGNDLADTAAKLAVRSFDTLPSHQTLRVDMGETAPRPEYWIMYTATPPVLGIAPTPPHNAGHQPQSLVVYSGNRTPPNARIYASITPTQEQSATSTTPQLTLHVII